MTAGLDPTDRSRGIAADSAYTGAPERDSEGLGKTAAAGVLWSTGQRWVLRLTGLATLAMLARLVTPEEFGVVAAATTVLPFLYLLADLGFGTYLVQAERTDQTTLSTGLWFSLAASLVLMPAIYVAAPGMSWLMGIPELTLVLRVLALSVLLTALSTVPTALLRRRMAFRRLAGQGVVAGLLAQGVAVVVALAGGGVWALVAQLLVTQLVMMLLVWPAARWVPALRFSARVFKVMAVFGVRVSAVDLLAAARAWGEATIIAATLGATALGYLSIAQRLVAVVQELSAASVLHVSVVVFARLRESGQRLVAAYVKALSMTYSLVAPILMTVAVTSPLLVPLVFGGQWTRVVPLAQALAIAGILALGAILDNGVLYGLGRPGTWLAYAFAIDVLTVAVTAAAVTVGLTAVAIAFVGVALAATAIRWVLMARALGCRARSVSLPFMRMVMATTVSGLLGHSAFEMVGSWPDVPAILLVAFVVGVSHLTLTRLTEPTVLATLLDYLPLPEVLTTLMRRVLVLPRLERGQEKVNEGVLEPDARTP